MIIEKIELENFMCFTGKCCFEFTEGINVIIGDNGYGKSKLYDAFYWVLYDRVFISEKKEFLNTRTVKSDLISDKVKYKAKDGKVNTSVRITFHNIEKDSVYILERKYFVTIKDGNIIEPSESELIVMEKEHSILNAKVINEEEKRNKILSNILPADVKDYLWFQGEQVESIIDFKKQDTLTKAINVLSSIKRFDEIKEIAVQSAKTANNEYDREIKKLSKDKDKSEELEQEKKQIEEKINDLLKEEEEVNDNLYKAETRCDELLNKQADAQKVNELQERKRGAINLLNELNERLKEDQVSFHKRMFKNKWVLKGTIEFQKIYAKKFSVFEQKKLQLIEEKKAKIKLENETSKNLQTRLPFNVPEPNYLEWMLKDEKCLVCDREAKKNTEPWKKIKELLDRPEKNTNNIDEKSLTIQNFTDDLKRLYTNGLSLKSRIEDIDDDIKETLSLRNSNNIKVKNAKKEFDKIEGEVTKLLSDTSMKDEDAANILNEFSIHNKKSKDFKTEHYKITQNIEYNRARLNNVKEQLNSLVTGEIPKYLIEKRDILNDFEIIAKNTRERVFDDLISILENESNAHFVAMTSGNRSTRGQIKLQKSSTNNYMPQIIDDNGQPLLGNNTSNLILVKLAVIMAIISAKTSGRGTDMYTLITDAPTSVFGEDYTIGFCKTVSKVYRQSIIMSKEFYKNEDLKNELLTNPDIKKGKIYLISPSILENERSNRNNLSTIIKELH